MIEPPDRRWCVYLLRCADDSLYCGVTTDLVRRLREHRSGRGSRYVRSRLPVQVARVELGYDRSSALRRELEIKAMRKGKKERLAL